MKKILNSLSKLISHYDAFGIQGIILIFKRFHTKKEKKIEIKPPNIKYPFFLRSGSSDIGIFYQIFLSKSYNLSYGINPNVIVDCGSNIGLSVIFFKNKFPNSTIVAVEPEENNFNLLLKNTEKYSNIHCLKKGIWNKETNLIIKNNNTTNWAFEVEEVDYENENTISAISISELKKKFNLDIIDILKIDIEGSEKELFEENYEQWLPKTKILIIELHDGMKYGASKSFFNAISKYNFHFTIKDENLIFYNKNFL